MDSYNKTMKVACHIWSNFYADEAPDWKPLDDTDGVLDQIDNMVSGLIKRPEFACSFCGKHQDECAMLISGPDVYICEECVRLCGELLMKEFIHKNKKLKDANYKLNQSNQDMARHIFSEQWGSDV